MSKSEIKSVADAIEKGVETVETVDEVVDDSARKKEDLMLLSGEKNSQKGKDKVRFRDVICNHTTTKRYGSEYFHLEKGSKARLPEDVAKYLSQSGPKFLRFVTLL